MKVCNILLIYKKNIKQNKNSKIFRNNLRINTKNVTWSKNSFTTQKMKFSIMDFFSKCDQIRSFLRIWSHLLKKSLIETLSFLFYKLNTKM